MRPTFVNDRINSLLLLVVGVYSLIVVNNNSVTVFAFNNLRSMNNYIRCPTTSLVNHHIYNSLLKNQLCDTVRLSLVMDPSRLANSAIDTTTISTTITDPATLNDNINDIGMLSKETTIIIFIIGIIPFIIATYEFWRRIAIGATFGTGNDSIVFPTTTTIGEDNAPSSSRGKQVLGQDSLIAAYIIFTTVAIVLGIVFYAILTSPPI